MKKYSLADYAFQFVTVTAGVLIALFIDGLVDWNHNRELVAAARATIEREIADNKRELDATVAGFGDDRKRFISAIQFAEDLLKAGKTSINEIKVNLELANLSSAGWRTAERTGALSHMEYDEVQRYSKLYDTQDVLTSLQRDMIGQMAAATALVSGDFDPGKPNSKDLETFRERVMLLQAALNVQEQLSIQLSESYAGILKAR